MVKTKQIYRSFTQLIWTNSFPFIYIFITMYHKGTLCSVFYWFYVCSYAEKVKVGNFNSESKYPSACEMLSNCSDSFRLIIIFSTSGYYNEILTKNGFISVYFELFSKNSAGSNKNERVKTVSSNGICKHLWSGKGAGREQENYPQTSDTDEEATLS